MSLGWKKFSFFDRDERDGHSLPDHILCSCASSSTLYIGVVSGEIHAIQRDLDILSSFQAFQHLILSISFIKWKDLLIGVGKDTSGWKIKVWRCDDARADTREPALLRTIECFIGKQSTGEISQMAVHTLRSQLVYAVGLQDGNIHILKADTGKDKVIRSVISAQSASTDGHNITGLAFGGEEDTLNLFVETQTQTLAFDLVNFRKSILDEMGADPGLTTVNQQGEFVVARTEAVYLYSADGRGPCFVFDGKKQQVSWIRHYLVAVTSSQNVSLGVPSHALQLFDLKNKFIAISLPLSEVPKLTAVAFGMILVLQHDNKLLLLKEKSLSSKLEILFNKSLYLVALNLAQSEQADKKVVADIQSRYASHLYNKHDHDGAMTQYLATIGYLEPSYVIRRFLDAQRIHNLTSYLEALHEKGLASADHTTLLLNCYTKLKDIGKLDKFLKAGLSNQPVPQFDVETAIKVCRSAGYFKHALEVAHAAKHSDIYLDILFEDCKQWDEALAYLSKQPRKEAAQALQKYGKVLVTDRPEPTVALLMKLCTAGESEDDFIAEVARFTHLFDERPEELMLLCEFIMNSTRSPPSEEALYHTLLQLYLAGSIENQEEGLKKSHSPPRPARREQALELLRRGWQPGDEPRYNPDAALILCCNHSFHEGLIFLYEKLRLFREVLRVYMAMHDYAGLIDACLRLGDSSKGGDPQLWSVVLEHLTQRDEDVTQQIQEVLGHIESGNLLPPLVILQILAKNPNLKLSLVKNYMARQLKAENASIEEDQCQIAKYEKETKAMRDEIHDLKTKAQVFQNTKCAISGAPLELPAVHFICGHSYNLRSLGDNEKDCPICAPQFRTILDIRRSLKAGASEQDKFFSQLRSSADGFSVIADFFGRGLLNSSTVTSTSKNFSSGS